MLDRIIFSTRLKELREEKGLSCTALAGRIGVTGASLGYYERGERVPDIETAQKLCKVFGVTSDYLLGLSDTPSPDIEDQAICKKLGIEGETLEALKMVFGTVHGVCMSTNEPGDQIHSNTIQLFVTASADFSDEGISDFYTRLTDSVYDRIEADKIIAEKEVLKANISNSISNASQLIANEDTIMLKSKSPEDIDVFYRYKSDIEDVYHRLREAIDKRDASEYRLKKSIIELLKKITKLWYEKYGGTEWQA